MRTITGNDRANTLNGTEGSDLIEFLTLLS